MSTFIINFVQFMPFQIKLLHLLLREGNDMDFYLIGLRWIHIFSGVFWAGSTFLVAGFLEPSIRATGPEGGKVMRYFAGPGRYTLIMSIAGNLVWISGGLLYWRVSSGLNPDWLSSGYGIGLTVGSIAGLVSAFIGMIVLSRSARRMVAIGKEIEAQGGPPSPEQGTEIEQLQGNLRTFGQINAVFMAIAVTGMAVAQYLWF